MEDLQRSLEAGKVGKMNPKLMDLLKLCARRIVMKNSMLVLIFSISLENDCQ